MQGARTVLLLGVLVAIVIAAGLWFGLGGSERPDENGREEGTPTRGADGSTGTAPDRLDTGQAAGAGQLTGRLVVLATGRPAPDVVVGIGRPGGDEPVPRVVSGSEGRFLFPALPPHDDYEVVVEHAEYATIRMGGLAVARSEVTDLGTLYLAEAVTFVVLVVDGGGAPLPGADVELHPAEARSRRWSPGSWMEAALAATEIATPLHTAKTGPDGRAEIADFPGGEYSIVAGAKGFARAGVTRLLSAETAGEVVTIRLARGYGLAGTVLGPKGAPVSGRVLAVPVGTRTAASAPLRRLSDIDEEGGYGLDRLSAGPLSLLVLVEGAPPVWAGTVEIPRLTKFDIRLGETAVLAGTVVDEAGDPIAGAEVRAMFRRGRGSSGAAKQVSDEEGRFVFEGVPPGSIQRIEALADGFARYPTPLDLRVSYTLSPGGRMNLVITLRRGGELTGVITRSGDAAHLGGARVTLMSRTAWAQTTASTTAGADGSYRLGPLVPGDYSIGVEAEGYFMPGARTTGIRPPVPVGPRFPGASAERWNVRIEAGVARTIRNVELEQGGAVSGIVVDSRSAPVAGARITASPRSGSSAFSGSDGTFRLVGLKPAERVTLTARLPGRWARSEPFSLAPQQSVDGLKLVMKAAASISGMVEHSGGGPPPGGVVRALAGRSREFFIPRSGGASAPIGADGSFRIGDVPPGELTVHADVPGHPPGKSDRLNVPEGGSVTGVRVVIPAGLVIRGVVTTNAGDPVDDASITMRGSSGGRPLNPFGSWAVVAQTDEKGEFEITGVSAGTYSVTAAKTGFTTASVSNYTPESGEAVKLTMASTGEISGRVVDERNRPLSGMTVSVDSGSGTGRNRGSGTATTGSDGTFRIVGLKDGVYKVSVKAAWGSGQNFAAETVEGVKPGEDIEIRVRPGYRITGRVTDSTGLPLQGVPVSVSGGEPKATHWVQTDADGRFEALGLTNGVYDVMVRPPSGKFAMMNLGNVSAGTEGLHLALREPMEIAGKVLGPDGSPLRNVYAQVHPLSGTPGTDRGMRSKADGGFRIQGLFPGAYDLTLTAPGRFAQTRIPSVSTGTSGLTVRMTLGESLSGAAVTEEGRKVSRVRVGIDMGKAGRANSTTNEMGEFTFGGLQAGMDYSLKVTSAPDGLILPEPVKARAGAKGVKLVLRGGLTIRGRVVAASGEGVPRAWVNVVRERRGIRADQQGEFEIKGLSPGEVEVQVFGAGASKTFTLQAGDQGVLLRMN